MEVEEKAESFEIISFQRSSLSHPTSRKFALNQQKLTCFAIVSLDQNNTISEKNILYIKFVQFISFSQIYTTFYSFYYPSKFSHLIINLDFALCAIVELILFLLYYPFYIFMHYNFAYKYFSVTSRANYYNILTDLSVLVGLLQVGHLHLVSSYHYSCK